MVPIAPAAWSPWEPNLFSFFVFGLMVCLVLGLLLFISGRVGEKKGGPEKLRAYESGIIPTGSARLRYPVPFFLVAIFFLIFDVEGAFIFTWAIAWEPLGWAGWLEITFFITMLVLGLVYIWRKQGLQWGPERTGR